MAGLVVSTAPTEEPLSLQEVKNVVEWLPEGHKETPYMEFRVLE